MNRYRVALLAVVTLLLAACARHVVLDPAQVEQQHDDRWTIHSEPGEQGEQASSKE